MDLSITGLIIFNTGLNEAEAGRIVAGWEAAAKQKSLVYKVFHESRIETFTDSLDDICIRVYPTPEEFAEWTSIIAADTSERHAVFRTPEGYLATVIYNEAMDWYEGKV